MAKLKEVRALKSSGVEPLAPTLIKRILHNLVLKAEDRRWALSGARKSFSKHRDAVAEAEAAPCPRRGASRLPRPVSVSSAATCWSAMKARSTARSMPSTRQAGHSRARSRSTSAAATRRAAFGPSTSGSEAATGAPTPSTSPMASTARPTGCLAPYQSRRQSRPGNR
jgi:hypothetical protein